MMKKQRLGTALAAVMVIAAMAATTASAQESVPPRADAQGEAPHSDGPHGPAGFPGSHMATGAPRAGGPMGPGFAVVNDLEQLRRLYALSGRPGDIVAVYHDVLNKTQDPMLRHYVYDSLAREQLKPANPDQAIATLRTSLAEDLAAVSELPHIPLDNASQNRPRQ